MGGVASRAVEEYGRSGWGGAAMGAAEAAADALAPKFHPSRHVVVPNFVARLATERSEIALAAGVKTEVHRLVDPPEPVPGVIVSQSPAAGERVRRDSVVTLEVEHRAHS